MKKKRYNGDSSLERSAPGRGPCPERLRGLIVKAAPDIYRRRAKLRRQSSTRKELSLYGHPLTCSCSGSPMCTSAHHPQLLMRFSWGMMNELLKFGRFGKTVPRCASSTPSHLAIGTI